MNNRILEGGKEFSPELFDRYDPPSRKALIEYLKKSNWECVEDPFGKYGIDIKATRDDGIVFFFDCEVRPAWRSGRFKYSTIHIPGRKKKFARLKNAYFVTIRADLKAAYFISRKHLIEDNLIKEDNKYAINEPFYNITFDNTIFVEFEETQN